MSTQYWKDLPKEIDPEFAGSIFERLGLSPVICPTCKAHCKEANGELICLNICHLLSEDAKAPWANIEHMLKLIAEPYELKGGRVNQIITPINTADLICSFTGEYAYLANFYPCKIIMHGLSFRSSEQAYHWHKLALPGDREYLLSMDTPMRAKKYARSCEMVPDWDEMRTGIMLEVLLAKFTQNPELHRLLIETGKATLVGGNRWGDQFWGCVWSPENGTWEGENHLGRTLMTIRDYF